MSFVPRDIQRIVVKSKVGNPPDFSPYLRTPDGGMVLRPIQNEMLWQASLAKGLLALVGVGEVRPLLLF